MIELSRRAEAQISALTRHYLRAHRAEAAQSLIASVSRTIFDFNVGTIKALPAPRPYPSLAEPGVAWTKSGRYWIAYQRDPNLILAVFFDTANIPSRL